MTVVDKVILTIAEIAARDHLSRAAVSKHVGKLVERHNLAVQRDQRGRVVGVDVATYDALRMKVGDSSKRAATFSPTSEATQSGDTLDSARKEKLQEETRLLQMRIASEAGNLVRKDLVVDAISRLAEEISRVLDLTQHQDAITEAAQRDDAHALRSVLKLRSNALRTAVADLCQKFSISAPRLDDALPLEEAIGG